MIGLNSRNLGLEMTNLQLSVSGKVYKECERKMTRRQRELCGKENYDRR